MFSFRHDKAGFFITIILIAIALGTFVTTVVLMTVGAAHGDWLRYVFAWKWVVGGAWVACIITVLVRVGIFRRQMLRAEERRRAQAAPPPADREPSART